MTANAVEEVRKYIDFLEIEASDILFARKGWNLIYPHAEGAMHRFYSHTMMREFTRPLPSFNEFVVIGKQIEYWDRLFSYGFDSDYIENVRRVSLVHQKMGVTLNNYVSSYGVILNEFEKILRTEHKNDPCLLEMLSGLRKMFFMDVSIACKMYDVVLSESY